MKAKTASKVYDAYTLAWIYRLEKFNKIAYDFISSPLAYKHDLEVTSVKNMLGFYKFYRIYKNLDIGLADSVIGLYLLNSISFEKHESLNKE